jgi:hypothetical protein
MAGQNVGLESPQPEPARSAYDVNEARRVLEGITDDGLKQIPVLRPETWLEQGATNIDLHDRREFVATGDMSAGPDNLVCAQERR